MALSPAPPMSSAERQRRFRERNPGYYARLQAKRRAAAKRDSMRTLTALGLLPPPAAAGEPMETGASAVVPPPVYEAPLGC